MTFSISISRRWVLALGVLAAAWAQPVAAHADPITAAVVTFIGLTGAAATVATFVINTGLQLAAGWALSKLAPKSAQSSQERQASVTTLSVGEMPRELIVGTAGTGGSLVDGYYYGGEHGTDWNLLVVALADHVCDGLVGFYVGDTYVAFGGDGDVAGYNGQLKVWWRPGAADDADFPEEIASLGPATAPGNLRGVAKVAVAYKADAPDAESPIWTSGRPAFLWVVRGALCYDPRKDSTVPGGDGDHRWDDPTTREFSDNAELCRYLFSRGVYALETVDEPAKLRLGRGLTAYEAPPERVFAAANLCDELVDLGVDETERRYRVGGVIRSSETFERVEQMFADAMGGFIIQPEGGVAVSPGEAKTPVASITDDDLVVGEAVRMTPFRSESDRVNTIIPRYVEPTQKWADTSAGVLRDLTDILADGGPLEETLPLVLVPFRAQAERIGEMRRRQHRLERTASITLGPRFAHLEEGDWIEWTSDRHFGGATLVFRITAYGLDGQWRNSLALEETSFYVYGFGAPPTTAEPSTPGLPPGALALSGVTAIPIQLAGEDGSLVPAIRFGWTVPVDPAISRIRAEVRGLGGVAVAPTTTDAVNAGTMDATNGVPAGGFVEARLVPLGAAGRAIVPSAWVPIITSTSVAGDTVKVGGRTAAELIADLDINALAIIREAMSNVDTRAYLEVMTYLDGAPIGSVVLHEITRTDDLVETIDLIGVKSEDGLAFILDINTVRVSPTESFAQRFTAIETSFTDGEIALEAAVTSITTAYTDADTALAQVITEVAVEAGDNLSAAVTTLTQAIIDGDEVSASLIESVTTTVDGHTASISTLLTSVNGAYARAAVSLNVDGYITGWEINNNGTTGSFIVVADEFGFVDPSGDYPTIPFSYSGGLLRMLNVAIDTLTANSIYTENLVVGSGSQKVFASTNSAYNNIPNGSTLLAATIAPTRSGGVEVRFYANFHFPSSRRTLTMQVYRNGSPISGAYARASFDGQDEVPLTVVFLDTTATAGGSYTYDLAALVSGADIDFLSGSLVLEELKA